MYATDADHERFIREDSSTLGYDEVTTQLMVNFNQAGLDLFRRFKAQGKLEAMAVKGAMIYFYKLLQKIDKEKEERNGRDVRSNAGVEEGDQE